MRYDYACQKCGHVQEEECSVATFRKHTPKCTKCGKRCKYQFTPTVVQFALKDGPSGSFPSKGERFKKFRAKQHEAMGRKQLDRYGHLRRDVVPNYGGKECSDWREAQSEAIKDRGLDMAASYNSKISQEVKKSKKIVRSR